MAPSEQTTESKPAAETLKRATARVQRTAERVLAWFPIRVWDRFNQRNGQVLAAGASYQALFAIFAAVYVAFAILGLWVGGNTQAISAMIDLINQYLPGAISDDGLITADQVTLVARQSATTLSITGVIALLVVMVTAVGWIGSVRVTVRGIFGLEPEQGNPLLIILRDFVAAITFAALLLLGAGLGWVGTSAIQIMFSAAGLPTESFWFTVLGRGVTILVMFSVNTATLVLLFRFLTATTLQARDVLPGSLLGAAGVTVLQLVFGVLIGLTPNNPLLVTFAVLIGLLLWIRAVMMTILLAAAWVAESANQRDVELVELNEHERELRKATLLRDAAELTLTEARKDLRAAPWYRRSGARLRLSRAKQTLEQRNAELAEIEESKR